MDDKKLGGQYPSLGIPRIPLWAEQMMANELTATQAMQAYNDYARQLEQHKKMSSGLFNPAPPKVAQMASATLTQEMAFNLLGGRLRIPQGNVLPFDHLSIHIGPERVTVFVMATGGPVILEDDTAMFPSDDLIGKLLLLRG